jgi:hypothetical protein
MRTMLSTSARGSARGCRVNLRREFLAVACALACGSAWGFTATLNPASPQTIYLQVGAGSFTYDYINGGQPE